LGEESQILDGGYSNMTKLLGERCMEVGEEGRLEQGAGPGAGADGSSDQLNVCGVVLGMKL
jgi:hypothetical protein